MKAMLDMVGKEKSRPRKLERGSAKAMGKGNWREGKMTDAQKIRIGILLVVAQCILLAMTFCFKANMDSAAERAGISQIIQEAGK